MRRSLLTILVLGTVGAGLAATSGGAATGHIASTRGVSVKDDRFAPRSITISRGTRVTWHWRGRHYHDVRGAGVHSSLKRSGSYSHRYSHAGTYVVYCSIHRALGMKMKIHVR